MPPDTAQGAYQTSQLVWVVLRGDYPLAAGYALGTKIGATLAQAIDLDSYSAVAETLNKIEEYIRQQRNVVLYCVKVRTTSPGELRNVQ